MVTGNFQKEKRNAEDQKEKAKKRLRREKANVRVLCCWVHFAFAQSSKSAAAADKGFFHKPKAKILVQKHGPSH